MKINNKTTLNFDMSQMVKRQLSSIYLIILHHRCGTGDVESIHDYHKNKLKWAGIGYHYYIRFDGKLYEGRPIDYIGAHCPSNNTHSIGICFEGDFRKDKPTPEQIETCRELVATLRKEFPSIKRVLNHNDLYATQCPIVNLKELIK